MAYRARFCELFVIVRANRHKTLSPLFHRFLLFTYSPR